MKSLVKLNAIFIVELPSYVGGKLREYYFFAITTSPT
jgi:hypothetical protein